MWWTDSRLPGWKFKQISSGHCIGTHEELNLTVQGDTESQVQEAAASAALLLEEELEEEDN